MITPLTKRLWILLGVLLCGLGSVFILPTAPKLPPPGILTTLPETVGSWHGVEVAVSDKEQGTLGAETKFARRLYTNTKGKGEGVYVSIVFSGEDMSTSIHRPERCLPAQGYTLMDSSKRRIKLENGIPLTITRLHNLRPIYTPEGKPVMDRTGKQFNDYGLVYYWFAGSYETTADHFVRYWIDTRDRIFKGNTQSWAYISVMGRITDRFGGQTEAQVDAMLEDFIRQLLPLIQKPELKIR